jgi:uncharacterized membrane protein
MDLLKSKLRLGRMVSNVTLLYPTLFLWIQNKMTTTAINCIHLFECNCNTIFVVFNKILNGWRNTQLITLIRVVAIAVRQRSWSLFFKEL